MVVKEYKNQFTLDGRIKPVAGVTPEKVAAADKLLREAMNGNHIAAGTLREVHTTSDLQFNIAHLVSVTMIPQFDAAERTWSKIAGTRVVPDLGPVRLQSLFGDLTGAGVHEKGGLLRVPEASVYPYVTVSGQEALWAKIEKFGAKFGFTWEASVSDVVGFFENIPGELLQLALDTEEREVYEALINGTTQELGAVLLPNGDTTLPNSPISPEAILAAILQLSNVEVNGRKVGEASGYNVIVPAGTKRMIEYQLNRNVIAVQDGLVTYGGDNWTELNNIEIIESEWVTGTEWYVIPKPGSIRRPILELGRLRGYETPELRVHNATGNYLGGSSVSPFEGSFDNDTIDYRIRYVAGGILWSSQYHLRSTGTGQVTP